MSNRRRKGPVTTVRTVAIVAPAEYWAATELERIVAVAITEAFFVFHVTL